VPEPVKNQEKHVLFFSILVLANSNGERTGRPAGIDGFGAGASASFGGSRPHEWHSEFSFSQVPEGREIVSQTDGRVALSCASESRPVGLGFELEFLRHGARAVPGALQSQAAKKEVLCAVAAVVTVETELADRGGVSSAGEHGV